MKTYEVKAYRRCPRTGCRITIRRVIAGGRWIAEHITMAAPAYEPTLEIIDDYQGNTR